MFGGIVISIENELVYYYELKKLGIIENPSNFPLNEINDSDHYTNAKYNGVKLNFLLQNHIKNQNANHNEYNPFDMMNIVFINSNRADWELCYSKQAHLTVGIFVMKHKASDSQITTFLNSMHYQIKQCFVKSADMPIYILTMKCHLIFHKLLHPNNCVSCFSDKNPSSDEYKEYTENDKIIEIEMNKLLDKDAISISTAPPSYSKIISQKSDIKQHSLKLSSTHPPSYNMDSMYNYQQLNVKQKVNSDNDQKSQLTSTNHSDTNIEEEEKYSVTYSDSDIIPQNRYSSSDVIAAAEELKFKQANTKRMINDRIKKGKISKKQAPYELKKAYSTVAQTYNIVELEMNYDTSFKYGLSTQLVQNLLWQYGPNEETPPKHDPMCLVYMKHVFGRCFNMLIWFATIFCYSVYGITDNIYYCHIGIVFTVYLIIILIYPFCQPHRDGFFYQPIHFSIVTRDGILQEIDSRELVPGDIVELKAGVAVPADMRIFECSTDLQVDNSSLTGESEWQRRSWITSDETPAEAECLCFRGTFIVSGTGRAVVIATGDETFMGRTAQLACSTGSDRGTVFVPPKFETIKIIGDNEKNVIESLIDNIFGDLENMFYLLSDLTYYFMFNEVNGYCDIVLNCFKGVFGLCIIYPFIIVVSLLIVLTSCFFLLVFRFSKIEIDSINVAVRQKIIEYESCARRCFRLVMQFIRSTFMMFILFVYPLIVIYVIIPRYNHSNTVATISIGSYLCVILLLQLLGTYRGLKSFQKKHETQKQCKYKPKQFIWNIGSIFTILMILFEINQMIFISYYSININSNVNQITSNGTLLQVNNILKKIISSLSFLGFTANINYYMAFCISAVTLLLIIFVFQFIYELRRYAYLKRVLRDITKARDFYFHSFIGTIIYGHGHLKSVSIWIVKIISILCDFLFLILCEKLILILVCLPSTNTLLIDSNVECWTGKHKHFAAISLILLSFYIPLSTMIAPIFHEENSKNQDNTKNNNKQTFWSFNNSIEFAKPYISAVTLTKCFMLFSTSFIFNQYGSAKIICNLLCSIFLIIFTLKWFTNNLYNYGLTQNEPIFPFSICLLRIFGFCCVIIGSFIEVLKFASIIDESCDFILLFALVGILSVVLSIITKRIHSNFNQFDDINKYNSRIIRYHEIF